MQATLQDYSRSATLSIQSQQSMEPQENRIYMLEVQTLLIILHAPKLIGETLKYQYRFKDGLNKPTRYLGADITQHASPNEHN